MAACNITIGGTSGSVLITYTLSGKTTTINAPFGTTQIIDDASTDITYTTLSGNATASSGCVTITAVAQGCYKYSWETIGNNNDEANGMVFDGVDFNGTLISVTETPYTDGAGYINLATVINDLSDSRITVISGKMELSTRSSMNNYMIVKVTGAVIPTIRITDPLYSHHLYLKGTIQADCDLPAGYTEFNQCSAPAL